MPSLTSMPALMVMLASLSGTTRPLDDAVGEVRAAQHGRVSESHLVRRVLAAWRLLLLEAHILIRKTQIDPGIAVLVQHGLPATLQLLRVLAYEAAHTLEPGRPHYGPAAWSDHHENVATMYNLDVCPRFPTFNRTVKYLATPSSGKMGAIDRLLVNGSLSMTDAKMETLTDAAVADAPLAVAEAPLTVVAGPLHPESAPLSPPRTCAHCRHSRPHTHTPLSLRTLTVRCPTHHRPPGGYPHVQP